MAGPIDKTRFGTGYISDMEKADVFVFAGTEHFDKGGAGGAVPVRGYTGPWPTFGKPEDSWEQQGDVGWSAGEGSSSSPSSSLPPSDTPVRRPRWMCKSTGRCSTCPSNEVSAGSDDGHLPVSHWRFSLLLYSSTAPTASHTATERR